MIYAQARQVFARRGFSWRIYDDEVADDMTKVKIKGRYRVEARDANGNPNSADLDVKFERLQLRPPTGKQKQYLPWS